jgi:hypothetical protein
MLYCFTFSPPKNSLWCLAPFLSGFLIESSFFCLTLKKNSKLRYCESLVNFYSWAMCVLGWTWATTRASGGSWRCRACRSSWPAQLLARQLPTPSGKPHGSHPKSTVVTKCLSLPLNWLPPPPSLASVCPPALILGGTPSLAGDGVGNPIQTTGQKFWHSVTLCSHPFCLSWLLADLNDTVPIYFVLESSHTSMRKITIYFFRQNATANFLLL